MKITLVGIYPQQMMVINGEFPVTIPKLGILARYSEEIDAFSDDGVLEVYFPGEAAPRITMSAGIEASRKLVSETVLPHGSDLEIAGGGTYPIILAPVVIKEPGYIRVRVRHRDQTIKIGACQILGGPVDSQ
jgi:hypothetical protein